MNEENGIYTPQEREARVKKELARIRKILTELNPDTAKLMDGLVQDAAFMAVTLKEARQIIMREGIIETYQNGASQSGRKKSSAVEVYDKMVNTYLKVVAKLTDGLGQGAGAAADGMMRFALGGAK